MILFVSRSSILFVLVAVAGHTVEDHVSADKHALGERGVAADKLRLRVNIGDPTLQTADIDRTSALESSTNAMRSSAGKEPDETGRNLLARPSTDSSDASKPGFVVLSKAAVKNVTKDDYWRYMNFTNVEYQGYASKAPGTEHYRLLHYLASLYPKSQMSELGTRYCTSAFALASEPSVTVNSFDLPGDTQFLRNIEELKLTLKPDEYLKHFPNIKFWKTDVMNDIAALKVVVSSKVVLLDTNHFPETQPFEYAFLKQMVHEGFSGLMLLDDINLNDEMKRLWKSCVSGDLFTLGRWNAYDLTDVGHNSGTGLLDFSKKLIIRG